MHWSFARDLIAPAAQALAEAICAAAYMTVLTPPGSTPPGFSAIAALFLAAAWLGRIAHRVRWRGRPHALILVPATLLVMPAWLHATLLPHVMDVGIGEACFAMGVALALWCRGLWLGISPVDTVTLTRRFVGGSLALFTLLLLLSVGRGTGVERFTATLQPLVLGYFVVGPATIALIHRETLHDRASARQSLSLAWVAALVTPMLVVAAVGLVLSRDAASALGTLLHAIAELLLWVAAAVVWLLYWPLAVLRWMFALLRPGTVRPPSSEAPSRPTLPPLTEAQLFGVSSDVMFYVLLAVTMVLAVAFLRALHRRRVARTLDAAEEERSSAWSWRLFGSQLRQLWLKLWGHLPARAAVLPRSLGARRHAAPPHVMPVDIRAIYRGLLRWAAVQGHARRPSTTPEELRRELVGVVPTAVEDVALITGHYEATRYGDAVIGAEDLAASRAAHAALASQQVHPA